MSRDAKAPEETLAKMLGYYGGERVTDTLPHAGNFCAIYALEDSVINTTTGNIENLDGTSLTAGMSILGIFTSVTLTSGAVILYNSEE